MSDGPNIPKRGPANEAGMEAAAISIVETLQVAGHTAYFAGGCVRDRVMNRKPHDYDVATSARPDEVIRLFRRTQQVGAKFGVVLVRFRQHAIEVATFRTDHEYADGRRPEAVTFSNPEEDAKRRDFTINGMFYDPIKHELIDFVGGCTDIEARLIRAIGEPERRFTEDHLRLMRAVRFAGRFDFNIEPATWAAIVRHAADIQKISPERVRIELELMLASPRRALAVKRLHECGLLRHLWDNAGKLTPGIASAIRRLESLPDSASHELAFAAMLADQPGSAAAGALNDLRASNFSIDRVVWLLSHQSDFADPAELDQADLKFLMANPGFEELTQVIASRLAAESTSTQAFDAIMRRSQAIPPEAVAPPPYVDGNDLKAFGLPPGRAYKRILDAIYRMQLNGELTSHEAAMSKARAFSTDPEMTAP